MLGFLLATAVVIIRMRNLFAVIMLTGAFSLLTAGLFVTLDAVDVAFTEAAVGAGITTVLFLGTLSLTTSREKPATHLPILPLAVVLITGAALVYGTMDLPGFGDPLAAPHQYVMPEYVSGTETQIGLPNIVTAVLASYRGFDTLGEVGVIFTAGVGVLLLLNGGLGGRGRRNGGDGSEPPGSAPTDQRKGPDRV